MTFRHGERTSVTRLGVDGSQTVFPVGQLLRILMDQDDAGMASVEIHVDSELLELCDLWVEPIEASRSPDDWRKVLGKLDDVMLVLNAGALLSDAEKRFVRDVLAIEVGLERVAILINKMDLIPDDERESIHQLVRTFLGPFESQPAILDLLVCDIATGRREGTGEDALGILMADLLEQRSRPADGGRAAAHEFDDLGPRSECDPTRRPVLHGRVRRQAGSGDHRVAAGVARKPDR